MPSDVSRQISIVAALIDDGFGQVFLVRKQGSAAFMLAGGKTDGDETPSDTLMRELWEELQFRPDERDIRFIGTFSAQAANEPDHQVEAQIFHIRAPDHAFTVRAELAEGLWVGIDDAMRLQLAPLARDHVLPLARLLCG